MKVDRDLIQVQILLRRAELTQQTDDPERHKRASEILLDAQGQMDAICAEINDVILQHDASGEMLKQEAQQVAENRDLEESKDHDGSQEPSDGDSAEDELPKTPAGTEHRLKRNALMSRLREAHIVLHQVYFRLGDVYHSLGESYSTKETEAYTAAEELRRRLLKSQSIT